jgi:hypothetical protein
MANCSSFIRERVTSRRRYYELTNVVLPYVKEQVHRELFETRVWQALSRISSLSNGFINGASIAALSTGEMYGRTVLPRLPVITSHLPPRR